MINKFVFEHDFDENNSLISVKQRSLTFEENLTKIV